MQLSARTHSYIGQSKPFQDTDCRYNLLCLFCGTNCHPEIRVCRGVEQGRVYCYGSNLECMRRSNQCAKVGDCSRLNTRSPKYAVGFCNESSLSGPNNNWITIIITTAAPQLSLPQYLPWSLPQSLAPQCLSRPSAAACNPRPPQLRAASCTLAPARQAGWWAPASATGCSPWTCPTAPARASARPWGPACCASRTARRMHSWPPGTPL